MKKLLKCVAIIALLFIHLLAGAKSVYAMDKTSIVLQMENQQAEHDEGEVFTIIIQAMNSVDLFGVQYTLNYNPASVQIVDGGIHIANQFGLYGKTEDLEHGTVTHPLIQMEPTDVKIDRLEIARFTFKALAKGETRISLSNVKAVNRNITEIQGNTTDEVYLDIQEPPSVLGAYVSIYLGDLGSNLHRVMMKQLKEDDINRIFEEVSVTVKAFPADEGTAYKGNQFWIRDLAGNIGYKDRNGRVIGQLNITGIMPDNAIVEITAPGYLIKYLENVRFTEGEMTDLQTTDESPLELLPGDTGREGGGIVLDPDGRLNHIDYLAWLEAYKVNRSMMPSDWIRSEADFTKDGNVNNLDFSLWLSALKRIDTLEYPLYNKPFYSTMNADFIVQQRDIYTTVSPSVEGILGADGLYHKQFEVTYLLNGGANHLLGAFEVNADSPELQAEYAIYDATNNKLLYRSTRINEEMDRVLFNVNVKGVQKVKIKLDAVSESEGAMDTIIHNLRVSTSKDIPESTF